MEEKWRWDPKRWSPFDSELVWADQFGMGCWVKEHSGLDRKKQTEKKLLGGFTSLVSTSRFLFHTEIWRTNTS